MSTNGGPPPRRPASARLGILVERRYLTHAQPSGLMAALRERGHDVLTIDPAAVAADTRDGAWLHDLDLVVGRGRSHALLSLLTWAESRGTPTINSRAAIAGVHNKVEMAVRLAAAGVPCPRTFLGDVAQLPQQVSAEWFPLILKPAFGDNCEGLRVVADARELAGLAWPEPFALAQQFIPTDGVDLKLYVVGQRVWAVRKPSPLHQREGATELVDCTPAMTRLALRCGRLFGLDLYGVDCVETPAGPLVLEVNEFPNYTGVPRADERLADHVLARLDEAPSR